MCWRIVTWTFSLVRNGSSEQKQWWKWKSSQISIPSTPRSNRVMRVSASGVPTNCWHLMYTRKEGNLELALITITTGRGPKDQIHSMRQTAPQPVIVYIKMQLIQVETVVSWVLTSYPFLLISIFLWPPSLGALNTACILLPSYWFVSIFIHQSKITFW